jgi:hypothetical protein
MGMEHLAAGQFDHFGGLRSVKGSDVPRPAVVTVHRVPNHRMPAVGKMDPYLVGAAGFQGNSTKLNKVEILPNLVVGPGGTAPRR